MTAPKAPLATVCGRCGARVLEVRWDHRGDVLIGTPLLDPVALDAPQVLACVITGLSLWQVHEFAGHQVTSHRTRWWPTTPIPGLIAPEHVCGRRWQGDPLLLAPDPTTIPELCPF